MSILIKGMEMPKEFDPDVYVELHRGIDGENYARLYNFHCGGLSEWCEIIPVPPHGDLKDADALDMNYLHIRDDGMKIYTQRAIDNAPTIIPAEEGE